jgi:alginate O-acetyltransferase complex protein AlgI
MNMDSASVQFVAFGLAAVILSNLNRSRTWRSLVLLVASLLFLGLLAGSLTVLLPLLGFLAFGYLAILLQRYGIKRAHALSIVAIVFVYVWEKKYTFLPDAILLHRPYLTLGLSYIFFRVLHLVIDASDDEQKSHIGIGAYLLYTLNFTTLVSGPIQRYEDFAADQFAAEPVALGVSTIGLQLERIVRGMFKVNVLAMVLNAVQQDAAAQLTQPLPIGTKLLAGITIGVAYSLFLYANFSGYIDIVIALARLMRVRLPENFDRPFSASSVLEFWNRWHMTLSRWLKTYVYNPLLIALMQRVSSRSLEPLLGVVSFFITFFLIGVWHGRTSEFIVFGLLTGAGVSINKLWQLRLTSALGKKKYREVSNLPLYNALGRGLNFAWFGFTLIWFWAGWPQIHKLFSALTVLQWLCVWLCVWLAATIVLELWERTRAALLSIEVSGQPVLLSRYARVVYASLLGLAAFVVIGLLNQPAPDIVYKQF